MGSDMLGVYARLQALRDNLPHRPHVSENYVKKFHAALTDLDSLGYDVVPFRVPADSVKPATAADGVVKSASEKKYVER